MMYWTVLFALLSAALLKRQSAPFAVVMLLNVAANEMVVRQDGLYAWVTATDGTAMVMLALLTWFWARKWWSFLITELALGAIAVHVTYGILSGFGSYYGDPYQDILNGAFMVSAMILVTGGYDLGRFVGVLWSRISLAHHLWACNASSGQRALQSRGEIKK